MDICLNFKTLSFMENDDSFTSWLKLPINHIITHQTACFKISPYPSQTAIKA